MNRLFRPALAHTAKAPAQPAITAVATVITAAATATAVAALVLLMPAANAQSTQPTAASPPAATTPTLTPPKDRLSDEALVRDQRTHEAVQARIRALNDAGRPLQDYHLAKAQCWLDASVHEHARNDRSSFPQDALAQSDTLLRAMEQRTTSLPDDTPLVNGAPRLRPDLWQRMPDLRAHAGWRCAQARTACAEVALVHAGNEHQQQGWRHAKPYVQMAEDLVAEAQGQAERCPSKP